MRPGYLKARMEDVHAREGSGVSPAAGEERSALLGALVGLGLPENAYVRDPSRPRNALYLYRDQEGCHELADAPWRLARHAPPGMLPEDVRRVGRELRRGLIGSLLGAVLALLGALSFAFLAPSAPRDALSLAAYLQAAPAILGAVCVLCALAALWHGVALLFPREALTSDARSRAAFASATVRVG